MLAAASLVLALGACGDDEDGAGSAEATAEATGDAAGGVITVADAWSRQPAEGQTVTAVYGIVSNPTDEDVTIVSAFTPVTDRVELHETIANDDGTMQMQQKEGGFVVPAGGEFVFESGGPHIMLFDIDPATYPASVDVTLTFDSGDPILFTAEVRAIDESMDMSMDMGGESSAMEMSGDTRRRARHRGDPRPRRGARSRHDRRGRPAPRRGRGDGRARDDGARRRDACRRTARAAR